MLFLCSQSAGQSPTLNFKPAFRSSTKNNFTNYLLDKGIDFTIGLNDWMKKTKNLKRLHRGIKLILFKIVLQNRYFWRVRERKFRKCRVTWVFFTCLFNVFFWLGILLIFEDQQLLGVDQSLFWLDYLCCWTFFFTYLVSKKHYFLE